MMEETLTVRFTDGVTCRAGDASEVGGGARRQGADMFLHQGPDRFNRIEIRRIRGQKLQRGSARFNECAYRRGVVGTQFIHEHDVAAPEAGREALAHPGDEIRRPDALPFRRQRHPSVDAHRAEQTQIVSPVHRSRFDIFLASADPRVRSAHRQIRAGFIEKDQVPRIHGAHPVAERLALRGDVRAVGFQRPWAFFLNTNPNRRSARWIPETLVRSSRATHRCSVRYPMPSRSDMGWTPASPCSYSATARSRNTRS